MRRELILSVKVLPFTSGEAIDRSGFLSAVAAVTAAGDGDLKIDVTHADTADSTFEPVQDAGLYLSANAGARDLKAGELVNLDLDLAGCRRFIRITVSGSAAVSGEGASAKSAACAVALGDHYEQPV